MKRRKPTKEFKRQKGSGYKYDTAFKRRVALQYINTDMNLTQVGQMFKISHQNVSEWARQFSSELAEEQIIIPMTEQEEKDHVLLKKQNEALKKKLEYEQMRNFALETMVDLAKSELGIDLRKNSGAKQPKE